MLLSSIIVLLLASLFGSISPLFIVSPRESINMGHHLTAAIASLNTFGKQGAKRYLCHLLNHDGLSLFVMSEDGDLIGCLKPNKQVIDIKNDILKHPGKIRLFKKDKYMTYMNQHSDGDKTYWIISNTSKVSWTADFKDLILIRFLGSFLLAVIFLSIILWLITFPLLRLRKFLNQISLGKLNARINHKIEPRLQDIKDLNQEASMMGESLEKFINLKNEVIEMISHEIKSPLTRQRVALNLIQNSPVDSHSKYIDRIDLENRRIMALTTEALEYIKLHTDKLKLNQNDFDLVRCLHHIIKDVHFEYPTHDFELQSPKKMQVYADEHLLKKALENMMNNAAKHTEPGKKITIKVFREKEVCHIIIKDRGPGIFPENLDKVFEPYFRKIKSTG